MGLITYNPDEKKITISGFTNTEPCTFEDIYQADITNGWGVFTKFGDRNYKTNAKLLFKYCYFTDNYATLLMENLGEWAWDYIFKLSTDAICKFNSISFYNYEATYECGYRAESAADVEFNNCSFYSHPSSKRVLFNGAPKRCKFEKCYSELYYTALKANFVNTIIGGRYAHIASPNVASTFNNLQIYTNNAYCFWFPSGDFLVNGGKYDAAIKFCYIRNATSVKIKNADLLKNNITIYNDSGIACNFTISFDVLFRILDENQNLTAKKLKITNVNGEIVFDSLVSEQSVELPLYTLDIVGDGAAHNYTEADYNKYLPYTIEVYDDLKTYYIN